MDYIFPETLSGLAYCNSLFYYLVLTDSVSTGSRRLPTVLPITLFYHKKQWASPLLASFYWAHISLTQLTYRFNWRTAKPLGAASPPGCDKPTSLVGIFLLLPEGSDYIFTLLKRRGWRVIEAS